MIMTIMTKQQTHQNVNEKYEWQSIDLQYYSTGK